MSSRRPARFNQNIKTIEVTKGTVKSSFSATGIVVSAKQINLDFDYPGELEDLYVKLGDEVTEGVDLAELDPNDSMIAKQTLESPIDGTIINIGAEEGESISSSGSTSSAGTSTSTGTVETPGFISIADLDNLQIRMSIDQTDIPKVKTGQNITVSLDAIPNKIFKGEITSINPVPVNDQNVITYTTYAEIKKPSKKIRLGMGANVNLELGKKRNVLIVPNLCIRTVNGHKVVTKIVNRLPKDVRVKVGASDDINTEIVSGLDEGDKVSLGLLSLQGESQNSGGMFGPR